MESIDYRVERQRFVVALIFKNLTRFVSQIMNYWEQVYNHIQRYVCDVFTHPNVNGGLNYRWSWGIAEWLHPI